ncbi:MAG TPA: hypothetical protein DC054_12060 [Blastocatellia bacterium]|nr:hypothetical protein [Blastocatellia bacterium]
MQVSPERAAYSAPSALIKIDDNSTWGDAPGFFISRPLALSRLSSTWFHRTSAHKIRADLAKRLTEAGAMQENRP